MIFQGSSARYFLSPALLLAIFLFPAFLVRSSSLTQVESTRTQLAALPTSPYLFLGNCALDGRIDPDLFAELSGRVPARILTQDGDMSVAWYLILKNIILSSGVHPRKIYLFFEQNDLTLPLERITLPRERLRIANLSTENEAILQQILGDNKNFKGKVGDWFYALYPIQLAAQSISELIVHYFGLLVTHPDHGLHDVYTLLRMETANLRLAASSRKVRQLVNQRLSPEFRRKSAEVSAPVAQLPAAVEAFDFARQLPKSLLPEMLRMAKEAGLPLVFVHFEPPPSAFDVPGPPPEILAAYKRDLNAYVRQHGMEFIDMTDVPGARAFRHRSYYVLLPEDRPGYTRFFARVVAAKNLN